jgi:hypothetical protein
MFTGFRKKINTLFFLCILSSAWITETTARTDYSIREPNRPSEESPEIMILRELGLSKDVNDTEIIQLLDRSDKRVLVTALIRYRKISLATPKLLGIVNDKKATIPEKLTAAKALCDFGNKEWMPIIKTLSTDPNGLIGRTPLQIDVAGLLARAGDYSQFEVVANQIDNSKYSVRYAAIKALENFQHKTDPVTDSAANLLAFAATSDSVPWLRERAIKSLEKIATTKPAITSKVIDALKANIDSSDKNLQGVCRAKLTKYDIKLKTD